MYHCKPTSNIDIYPSTLVLLKILGISMIFWGVECSLVESGGGGPDPQKKVLIHIYLQSMF